MTEPSLADRYKPDELLAWYECGRKVRHPDERAAKTGAHLAGPQYGWWECNRCGGWHVGTTPKRRLRPGKVLKRARKKLANA